MLFRCEGLYYSPHVARDVCVQRECEDTSSSLIKIEIFFFVGPCHGGRPVSGLLQEQTAESTVFRVGNSVLSGPCLVLSSG